MENNEGVNVDGFIFYREEMQKKAKREEQGVQYIRERMQEQDPEQLLKLYQSMVKQEVFETVVGVSFLKEVQDELLAMSTVNVQDVPAIPVKENEGDLQQESKNTKEPEVKKGKEQKKTDKKQDKTTEKLRVSFIMNLLLLVGVIAMFVILNTSGSVTILNYENELINKYEAWDQDLTEREAEVSAYEQEYGIGK